MVIVEFIIIIITIIFIIIFQLKLYVRPSVHHDFNIFEPGLIKLVNLKK